MTREPTGPADEDRPRFTDKRRIDPETGQVRPEAVPTPDVVVPDDASSLFDSPSGAVEEARAEAAEHLADLQRLQAEFVNYRKRVDRDRDVARQAAVLDVIESLVGALDEIELAREHGELGEGPFASIAEKVEQALGRFGWQRYGAVGEPFDPTVHEAILQQHSPEVTEPTVAAVARPGHRVGERVLRAAQVVVSAPEE